jgi:GNAT superfamily N-acetyltransferase
MPDDPQGRLMGAGLNSIPSWCKPFHVLSNGEQFRAEIARRLTDGAVFDEFTSVVDRDVAKSCAYATQRFIRSRGFKRVIFATCHSDVEEWLQPDWVFDTGTGGLHPRDCLCRPRIELHVHKTTPAAWGMFRKHHYLTEDMNLSARCFLATWDKKVVGFASALAFPNGNFKNAWREHRTVVLPDFQGLGIGVRLSDFVAGTFLSAGCRYFSKTSHPRMGGYRENSPFWKATSKNRKSRPDYAYGGTTKEDGHKKAHAARVCFSHEFCSPTE